MSRRRKTADDAACASVNDPQSIPSGAGIDHATLFPGLRPRHDGWTQARTQRFLDTLAHTGCVADAARVAGMSVVGARRMRARYPAFAAAWDDALDRAHRGLIAIAYRRAVEGKETVIIRKGEEYERRIAPSDSILGLLVKRGDLAGGGEGGRGGVDPDTVINFEEYQQFWRFDDHGRKVKQEDPEAIRQRLVRKFALMRERMWPQDHEPVGCQACNRPLPGRAGDYDRETWLEKREFVRRDGQPVEPPPAW